MRCKTCKKKISEFARVCPYCKAVVLQTQDMTEGYFEKLEKNPFQVKEPRVFKEFHLNKKAKAAAGCVMVAVIMLGYTYYKKSNVWEINQDTIYYQKDNQLIAKNIESDSRYVLTSSVIISDSAESDDEFNQVENNVLRYDEKTDSIFYAGDIEGFTYNTQYYSIYQKDCKNPNKKASCIAENVYMTKWTKDGGIYYTTNDKSHLYYFSDGEIKDLNIYGVTSMQYNEGLNVMLITAVENVTSMLDITDENYYVQTIYAFDCNDNSVTRVCEPIMESVFTEDLSYVYYLAENNLYEYDVATCKTTKIGKNIMDFVYVNSGNDKGLYYIKYTLEEHSFSEYFKDEYKDADERVKQSEKLQDEETEQERKQREDRDILRESAKNKKVYFYNTVMYCHSEDEDRDIAKDVNYINSNNLSVEDMPTYSKLEEGTISFTYEDVKENVTLKDVEGGTFFVYDDNMDNECWTDTVYYYKENENGQERTNYVNVCVITNYTNYYIEDGKEEKVTEEDYDLIDEWEVSIGESNIDEANISINGLRYYIDAGDFSLIRQNAAGEVELLGDEVKSYQVLESGKVLYIDNGEADTLVCIKGDDTITIDTDVIGIYGTNAWNYMNN